MMISLQWFKCLAIDRALMYTPACIHPQNVDTKTKNKPDTCANPVPQHSTTKHSIVKTTPCSRLNHLHKYHHVAYCNCLLKKNPV